MTWALVIVLAGRMSAPPDLSWHQTQRACEAVRAEIVAHYQTQGREVISAECYAYRVAASPSLGKRQ